MNREIKIHTGAASDKHFLNAKTNEPVICAFDLTRSCYSTCAACDMSGSNLKAFCIRGSGNKEDFVIGYIKD